MNQVTQENRSLFQAVNDVAEQVKAEGKLPADTTAEDVAALYEAVYDGVSQRVKTLESQSTLSRVEAEVWALRKSRDGQGDSLTDEAIAHVLCDDESPFGDVDRDAEPETPLPPTAEAVRYLALQISRQHRAAEGLVKETVTPNHEEKLDSTNVVCLDFDTLMELRDRRKAEETVLDDTVSRLLAETAECRSLEEFLRDYLDARGRDAVVQLVVHRPRDEETGVVHFTAHTADSTDKPPVAYNTDVLEVESERYDFMLSEDPYGPALGEHRVTVFSSCEIEGQDPVALEDGIEAARDVFQDERLLPKPQPTP